MSNNTIISEVWKAMSSKEGIKIMRDAQAMQVAGSVVGIAIRNALYKRSKARNGWYAKYLDIPFVQKWCKADDKSVIIGAVIATALDTVLMLDRYGAIKLRSIEDEDSEDSEDLENDCKTEHEKAYNAYKAEMAVSAEKTAEAVPPRDNTDDDEDEYAPY